MHKYYDWQLIEDLPLASLGELLSFAYGEEKRKAKEKLEDKLFPLWLANYAVSKMRDEQAEVMDFEEFLRSTFEADEAPPKKSQKQRTAEDIIADIMPFVEADKKKRG